MAWTCPKCGSENSPYLPVCACGYIDESGSSKISQEWQELLIKKDKAILCSILVFIIPNLILFFLSSKIIYFSLPLFGLCALVFKKKNRGTKVVIWLRRFHQDERKFKFRKILSIACEGISSPITIQDSTIERNLSSLVFALRYFGCLILSTLVIFTGIIIVNMPLVVAIFFILFSLTIILFFLHKVVVNSGYIKLTEDSAIKKTQEVIDQAKAGKGPMSGLTIIRCEDTYWQKIVQQALKDADIVIIDITDLNENLLWEIKETKKYIPLSSIIFVLHTINGEETIPLATKIKLNSIINKTEQSLIKQYFCDSSSNLKRTTYNYRLLANDLRKYIVSG